MTIRLWACFLLGHPVCCDLGYFIQARGNHFSTVGQGQKSSFIIYHVDFPTLEIVLIVNGEET